MSYDEFTKLDIRIGTIIAAEKVKKPINSFRLQIDTGLDQRTVVSGIAAYFKPEEIIGQQVCLLADLSLVEDSGD